MIGILMRWGLLLLGTPIILEVRIEYVARASFSFLLLIFLLLFLLLVFSFQLKGESKSLLFLLLGLICRGKRLIIQNVQDHLGKF